MQIVEIKLIMRKTKKYFGLKNIEFRSNQTWASYFDTGFEEERGQKVQHLQLLYLLRENIYGFIA